jgi:hypothetical protein
MSLLLKRWLARSILCGLFYKRQIKRLSNLRIQHIQVAGLAVAVGCRALYIHRLTHGSKLSARIAPTVLLNYLHISYPSAGGGRTGQQTRAQLLYGARALPIYHAIHFP